MPKLGVFGALAGVGRQSRRAAAVLVCALAAGASAQNLLPRHTPAPPSLASTALPSSSFQLPGAEPAKPKGSSPGHIFVLIPAYQVEYLKNVPPLSPREKFMLVVRNTYDPTGLAVSAAEAALQHKPADGFCGYGHGWGGYGKCYGAALLDTNTSGFIGDFALPVLFHQDPRYFRLGEGGFKTRFLYAISRVVITRTDKGGLAFNTAVAGTAISGVLSNAYYPKADRGVGLTISRMGIDLGNTALFDLGAEFWADIQGKLFKRNARATQNRQATPQP